MDNIPQTFSRLSPIDRIISGAETTEPSQFKMLTQRFVFGLGGINAAIGAAVLGPESEQAHVYDFMKEYVDISTHYPGQGLLSKGVNEVAELVGAALNPINALTARAGLAVGTGINYVGKKVIGEAVTAGLADTTNALLMEAPKIKRITNAAGRTTELFTQGVGYAAPFSFVENVNKGKVDWQNFAIGSAAGGALNIAFHATGYMLGIVHGKYKAAKAAKLEEASIEELMKAGLSADEAKWFHVWKNNPDARETAEFAADILLKKGHNVDVAELKVVQELLTESEMRQLNTFMFNEAGANLETNKRALSQFILGNASHRMKRNPDVYFGVEGVLNWVNNRIKNVSVGPQTEKELSRLKSYSDLLSLMSKVIQTNFIDIADNQKVINYLKEQLDQRLPKIVKQRPTLEKIEKDISKIPSDLEADLAETYNSLKGAPTEELKQELEEVTLKFKEFKNNPTVFENLIKCVLGGLNG
jgi:hypothetical protein